MVPISIWESIYTLMNAILAILASHPSVNVPTLHITIMLLRLYPHIMFAECRIVSSYCMEIHLSTTYIHVLFVST